MELYWNTSLLQPTFSHSNQRKMLRRGIGPQRVGSHDPLIESEAARLMYELVPFKGNPAPTIQRCAPSARISCSIADNRDRVIGRLVSKMAYGQKIWKEMGNELDHWNIELMELVNEAFFTFWIVDIFPFCIYLSCDLSRL
jgi:hypothetical protein